MSDTVLFSETDGVATVTFNRTEINNALSLEDLQVVNRQLRSWRNDNQIAGVILRGGGFNAFSIGENFQDIYRAMTEKDDVYLTALSQTTHQLVHLWANYPKPTMAVMNGMTMGVAAVLAMASAIRVVTDLTLFSVPQCRLGLVPDTGSAYYLAKCPGKIGLFLSLTGMEIRAPGMLHAGIGTHYVQLQDVDWVNFDNVETLTASLTQRPLAAIQPELDRCFGQRSINEIVTVLSARREQGFRDILHQLQRGAPLALELTYRHLNASVGQDLTTVLQESYHLNRALMDGGDPLKGIRAHFIDRDGRPSWTSSSISSVELDGYFNSTIARPGLVLELS